MIIRPYSATDRDAVWSILEPVFRAGETYAVARDISADAAVDFWTDPTKSTFVAVDEESGEVLGSYYLRVNYDGPASHVANCGYAVAAGASGKGVASRMCEHSQVIAAERGFRAIQFNFVVSTNERAVRLWRRMGFEIVGTLPDAFEHPRHGYVDVYVMFKRVG